MSFSTKMLRQAFLLIPLLGFGLLAQAQSATVTVTNTTACEVYVTVYGSITAGNCSGPGSSAQGVVPANSSVVLSYSGTGVYFNVGATSVYSGPISAGPYTSWANAVHPLQTCPGAVNWPGSSPCGGYFLSLTPAGNVEVN